MYRVATVSDIDSIAKFQIAMARETEGIALDADTCTAGVRAVFENPGLGKYFVGELEGRIVCSCLITYEWSDWRNGVVWWIQSVYVIAEARRKGIYAGMYEHIQNLALADNRVQGVRLYVDQRNSSAQAVYSRLGMNGDHYRVFEWMKP
jgi:GNAT superfamily N-acetyltransferase